MAILSHRPSGVPVHTFTIRIDQSVYDKTVECAKKNLWSLAFTVENLLAKAHADLEGGNPNAQIEPNPETQSEKAEDSATQLALTPSE